MKNRFGLLILLTLFLLILLSSCKPASQTIPILRIGHAPHDHHAALYIAAMNSDYFRNQGGIYLKEIIFRNRYKLIKDNQKIAEIQIVKSTGGKEIIRKLSEDQFDLSFGGVPAMLSFIDNQADVEILAPAMTDGAMFVVANSLPADNWPQFVDFVHKQNKPVRIGYKIDISVQNLIFEKSLREEGLSYSKDMKDEGVDIILLNMHGAKTLIPALSNDIIDGFIVNQPFPALAQYQEKGKAIATVAELPPVNKWAGMPCCALAGNKDFVASEEPVTEALVTLLLRANRFITEQPELAAEQISTWLDIPVSVEAYSLPTIHFTTEFDDRWDKGLNFWVESMIESGHLSGMVKEAYKTDSFDQKIYNKQLYKRASKQL